MSEPYLMTIHLLAAETSLKTTNVSVREAAEITKVDVEIFLWISENFDLLVMVD